MNSAVKAISNGPDYTSAPAAALARGAAVKPRGRRGTKH